MRLTCLKCGHQMEVATGSHNVRLNCVCGRDFSYPEVVNTGTRPSEQAAERSRSKAFRAAGVVKDVGGFALGISLLGILFFPIGLLGAAIGVYVLTMLRGPLGRYSGRRSAVAAVAIGAAVFLGEGAFAMSWLKARRVQQIRSTQATVSEDLRALLRAQRLFRATHDTYGTFREFRFRPPVGSYTFYLGADDLVPANRDLETVIDPLPEEFHPAVNESTFTAVAVANLDHDPYLDVWSLNDHGAITHLTDDISDAPGAPPPPPPPEGGTANEAAEPVGSTGSAEPAMEQPAKAEGVVEPTPANPKPAPRPAPKPKPMEPVDVEPPAPQPRNPEADTAAPPKALAPAEPKVEPAEPKVEPAEPKVEPAEPRVEPAEPRVEPAEPELTTPKDVKTIDELIDSAPE